MFSIGTGVVFFVIAIVLFKLYPSVGDAAYGGRNHNRNVVFGWSIFFAVVGGLWLLGAIVFPYASQITDFSLVRQTQTTIKLFSERRENLVAVVRAELGKYPEYEKKIMGGIKPEILFQFPVLKSNETIVKTVEQIVKLEDDVYKLRSNLIEIQANIYWREISPWVIYVKPYQQFFGESNPVALKK